MAEILAPAGSFDALRVAIINGADAVYLGLSKFSARAKAENFDNSVLKEAIEYAHLFGVKVYVAVNTLVKNQELPEAVNDAVNALDVGAVRPVRLTKNCERIFQINPTFFASAAREELAAWIFYMDLTVSLYII